MVERDSTSGSLARMQRRQLRLNKRDSRPHRLTWTERFEVLGFLVSAGGFVVASLALALGYESSESDDQATILVFGGFIVSGLGLILGISLQRIYVTRVVGKHSRMLDQVTDTIRHDVAALAGLGLASDVIYQPAAGGTRSAGDTLRAMSSRALLAFLSEDYHRYVENLNGILRLPDRPLRLDGERLIGLAVRELERLLPSNCCWLGVTKISGDEWRQNKAIHDFLTRSRVRVKNGEWTMRVIYVYEHCPAAIRAQMEQDEAMDVHVKHWVGDVAALDDISLVLQRASEGDHEPSKQTDTLDWIRDHYEPICLLRFDVANGGLKEMSGFRGESVEFEDDFARFREWWSAAKTVTGTEGDQSSGKGRA